MKTHINRETAAKMGLPMPKNPPAVLSYDIHLDGEPCAGCAALRAQLAAQGLALEEARAALVKIPDPVKQPDPEKPADEKPRMDRKPR
jgi:hypothetical protein